MCQAKRPKIICFFEEVPLYESKESQQEKHEDRESMTWAPVNGCKECRSDKGWNFGVEQIDTKEQFFGKNHDESISNQEPDAANHEIGLYEEREGRLADGGIAETEEGDAVPDSVQESEAHSSWREAQGR